MEYKIEYMNTKGVINTNPITFNENNLPINLNPLIHQTLDFVGWLDKNENIVTKITESDNQYLYALWKEKENYVVMFEENALLDLVTNMPDNVVVNSGESINLSNQIPLRKGYEFLNWNTNKDNLGIKYNPSDKINNIIENKVLYAIWKPNTTTTNLLKYDSNSDNVSNMPDNLKFNSGEEIKISDIIPIKKNSIFLNWNTNKDNTGEKIYPNQNIVLNDDSVLYANWIDLVNIVTIEFDGNGDGDIVSNVPAAIAVTVGDSIVISKEIPIRDGYRFLNWNSNKDGSGKTILPGETITNVLMSEDYYAQWEKSEILVTIQFNGNGSNVYNIPENIIIKKGKNAIISNEIPTRENYIFLNWNLKKDNTGEKIYPNQELKDLNDNEILYAIWYKLPNKIINICKEYKCICCGCKKNIIEVCNCK